MLHRNNFNVCLNPCKTQAEAWCVAEIVEGNILGISARISVLSNDAVDQHYDRLSLLDVRDCEASVESDKDHGRAVGWLLQDGRLLEQIIASSIHSEVVYK